MREVNGYFKNGHPYFSIMVYGYSPEISVSIIAMLDTGFTGFLYLPLAQCLQSALILASTAPYTLADGNTSYALLALGTIVLEKSISTTGLVAISMASTDALIGMEFLRKLGGRLEVDTKTETVKIKNIPPELLKNPKTSRPQQ